MQVDVRSMRRDAGHSGSDVVQAQVCTVRHPFSLRLKLLRNRDPSVPPDEHLARVGLFGCNKPLRAL